MPSEGKLLHPPPTALPVAPSLSTPGVSDLPPDNDCPAGATSCKISWERHPGLVGSNLVFHIYWFADLEQDPANDTATCETRSMLLTDRPLLGKPQDALVTKGAVSLNTPSDLPAGCRVEEWVASVLVSQDDGKVSRSGLAFRDP